MTLLQIHLASILEPETEHQSMIRIPDIIDDADACDLLGRANDILAAAAGDPAAQIHADGYRMAARLLDLAKARRRDLSTRCLEDTPTGIEALADIHYAEQLAAHHLDMIDRISSL